MTDTPPPDEPDEPDQSGDADAPDELQSVDPAAASSQPPAPSEPPRAAEKPSFWHRRYVEKFVVPLVLPIVVVLAVLVYVLNVSRLFLSAHGNLPIIIGTVILLVVLTGASLLSSGDRMQTPTVILLTSIFLLALSFAGWISLGHSEESESAANATLPPTLKTTQTVKIIAGPGGQLIYNPNATNVKTGLVQFQITWASTPHTFSFHEDSTLFAELVADGVGKTSVGVAYFGAPGEYQFFCSIPGHEAAGMKGTVTVAGAPVTLAAAEQAAGNPPSAGAG
jgi:plastocyanin